MRGTLRHGHAGSRFCVERIRAGREPHLSPRHDEDLFVLAVHMLWRHCRARRQVKFDEPKAMTGARPVFNNPGLDRTAARTLAFVRPHDAYAQWSPLSRTFTPIPSAIPARAWR